MMKSIRPDNPEPLTSPKQGIGQIFVRFAVLLVLVIVVLAWAWHR